jgi:shikimate dehydrogenase
MSETATQLVGLIGWPVEQSVSPAMHNAAFDALGLPWRYTLLPTPPGRVKTTIARLRRQDYRGANVTVPHKRVVIPYLDNVDEATRAIGAVNTIVVQEGRLLGCNTDGAGFLVALREAGFEPTGRRALVLGAGGGARAVVYALSRADCSVAILSRRVRRAAELAHDLGGTDAGAPVTWVPREVTLADLPLADFDLLVHSTPVGMWPQVEASLWPEGLPLPSHWTVFDLVYNPGETRLLSQARAAGATAIGGLGMLVHQGALGFELWTGHRPPVDGMRAAAERALRNLEESATQPETMCYNGPGQQ